MSACLLILLLNLTNSMVFADTIQIKSNTNVATAGYYQLDWSVPGKNTNVLVEESTNVNFTEANLIYNGADSSTVISGKSNGDYFYRIKTPNVTEWSEPIKVTVEHHSLLKAFLFFFCGLIIFTSIVVVIIKKSRQQ